MRSKNLFVVLILFLFAGCKDGREPEVLTLLKLDKTSITLDVGENELLTVTGVYSNGEIRTFNAEEVRWDSSDEQVFSIKNGLVVALAPGAGNANASVDGETAFSMVTVRNPSPGPGPEEPFRNISETLQNALPFITGVTKDQACLIHSGVQVTEFFFNTTAGHLQTYFFEINLSDPSVTLLCTTPYDKAIDNGRERVREQFKHADAQGRRILGGTNGDYFSTKGTHAGRPQGIFWHDATCQKSSFNTSPARPRSFFFLTEGKKAYTAPAADYASVVKAHAIKEAFGGGQVLLEQGRAGRDVNSSDNAGLHPRTFIGVTQNAKRVFLVVVDGRSSLSIGMAYKEMSEVMAALGCWSAINLDGGGSSTFVVRDGDIGGSGNFKLLNKPSDGSERAVGPSVAVVALD